MSMPPNSTRGPYTILSPIGAGGMGEVYKARDTKLDRFVAVKVLPKEFSKDPDRLARFEREAKAVAALSHPNILSIYDFGKEGDTAYAVTELLEGETLRERLASGALPVRKAVEYATQIAKGLSAAHGKGIVHRDLKPENIFLTREGHLKILDFGLAGQAPLPDSAGTKSPTVTRHTEPGTLMGTVGYMSPEQVRGKAADQRSDIFSLGAVLYETVSGQRAFQGDSQADVLSAILKEDPPGLKVSGKPAPPALDRIIRQCIEKRPEDRFQSAHDLALALEAASGTEEARSSAETSKWSRRYWVALVAGAAVVVLASGVALLKFVPPHRNVTTARPPKIVVLPFENLGPPEDAYFAAGMTEEVTSRLANVKGLGVISRTSAVGYDCRGKTAKQIGSDLGVDYLLEGSVRWEHGPEQESRVRITPQLIRVEDDSHVWTDRYDRVLADVFTIQSEVAESTVKAMGVALLPHEQAILKEVWTSDLEAYDFYLRGQELRSYIGDRKGTEDALQMYQAAVDRDPSFAQALAGLARTHLGMYWGYFDRNAVHLVKAREAAEKAARLRPELSETHTALGWYFYQGLFDYPRALDEFATATKIQPSNSDALYGIGAIRRRQGRWDEAVEEMSKALELDPKNATLYYDHALTCVLARRYAEADRDHSLAISLYPQWGAAYGRKVWLQLLWHGDLGKAQAALDEAGRVSGLTDEEGLVARYRLDLTLARRDYPGALRQLQAETRDAIDNQDEYSPITLLRGQVQELAGQHELARRSFETACRSLQQKALQAPEDHRIHSSLGIAYAGLGRGEDAVREAQLACDLKPPSKDALVALVCLNDLALVNAMVGQKSQAIAQLDDLLARSGMYTAHLLRLDPRWDALRSEPAFEALLKKYEANR